jgi:hypothetical protein
MKKILFLVAAVGLIFVVWGVQDAKTKDQAYYSGDAVFYQNQLLIASTNTGRLELFKVNDNKVERLLSASLGVNPSKTEVFNDVKLEVRGNRLLAYTVAGYTLYRYDLSDLQTARLENKVRNNYWEWYHRVDRFAGEIVTISDRGMRIWNEDLQVVNGFDLNSELPYSIRSSGDKSWLFYLNNSVLNVYNRESRSVVRTIALDYKDFTKNSRRLYYDRINAHLFVTDDYYVKKFDLNGRLLASFRHYGDSSYDTESSFDNNFIYVSNGLNVYKLNKSDLSLVKDYQAFNATPQGWAMGLKFVNTNHGDRLVLFNNSGLAVLDANFNLVASSGKISQDDGISYPLENLYLVLNSYTATVDATVNIQGGGFMPNEELKISFKHIHFSSQADRFGRFNANLFVPEVAPGRYDVKIDGLTSELTYSTALQIVE